MALAVVAENIYKTYKKADVPALGGVSMSIERGKVYGLLGPNGAGKTTLIRVLATLLKPDSGTATVEGIDVVADPIGVRTRIGLGGQYAAVDEFLTGLAHRALLPPAFPPAPGALQGGDARLAQEGQGPRAVGVAPEALAPVAGDVRDAGMADRGGEQVGLRDDVLGEEAAVARAPQADAVAVDVGQRAQVLGRAAGGVRRPVPANGKTNLSAKAGQAGAVRSG